jgi:hypothetical protein
MYYSQFYILRNLNSFPKQVTMTAGTVGEHKVVRRGSHDILQGGWHDSFSFEDNVRVRYSGFPFVRDMMLTEATR